MPLESHIATGFAQAGSPCIKVFTCRKVKTQCEKSMGGECVTMAQVASSDAASVVVSESVYLLVTR